MRLPSAETLPLYFLRTRPIARRLADRDEPEPLVHTCWGARPAIPACCRGRVQTPTLKLVDRDREIARFVSRAVLDHRG